MSSLHLSSDYSHSAKSQSPLDLYSTFDLLAGLAPDPQFFESELDSDLALSTLDFNTYAPLDDLNRRSHPAFQGDYRSVQYPGPASSFTVSSESQSGYEYEASSYYSSRDSSAGYNPMDAAAPYPQQQQTLQLHQPQPSYIAHPSDLDLDFNDFNLAAGPLPSPTPLPKINTAALDSVNALMDAHSVSRQHQPKYERQYELEKPKEAYHGDNVPRSSATSDAASAHQVTDDQAARKYHCPSCPRSFARAFNLKTHRMTHDQNRTKPFVCRVPSCGRSFSRKHDLGRHLTSIHGTTSSTDIGIAGRSRSSESSATSPGYSKSSNGGRVNKERVWCDGCGRGWIKGDRDGCLCRDARTKERVS